MTLVKALRPVAAKVSVQFRWLMDGKEHIFKSISSEPAIALYNCAVCINNKEGLSDLERLQQMDYYITKASQITKSFEAQDLVVLSQALKAIQ